MFVICFFFSVEDSTMCLLEMEAEVERDSAVPGFVC